MFDGSPDEEWQAFWAKSAAFPGVSRGKACNPFESNEFHCPKERALRAARRHSARPS
jgi:hypothetical protein